MTRDAALADLLVARFVYLLTFGFWKSKYWQIFAWFQGALIGSGASLFGIGSDIAGSIRVPALFNGIFGHKPTGGLLSVIGHFPYSTDECFSNYLVVGPMCRYAKDLPTLLHIMAGKKAEKLRLNEPLYTKNIKVSNRFDKNLISFCQTWTLLDHFVNRNLFFYYPADFLQRKRWIFSCRHSCTRRNQNRHAKRCTTFQKQWPGNVRSTNWIDARAYWMWFGTVFHDARHSVDFTGPKQSKANAQRLQRNIQEHVGQIRVQFCRPVFLLFVWNQWAHTETKNTEICQPTGKLSPRVFGMIISSFFVGDWWKRLTGFVLQKMLGDNGVMFYPTYPTSAVRHNDSFMKLCGVSYTMIFNLFGFPSTHVPLGRDINGLPVGFQIVAAPYQDRLCLCLAAEIEAAFGGWKPPYE